MATSIDDVIDKLAKQYDEVLRACYEALAADAPQEKRDALREAINEFLRTSDTER